MFTINNSHMIYGFSDMQCNRQNFLSVWKIFYPFTPPPSPPLNNSENQNFEKLKKAPGAIIILHMCTKNHKHLMSGIFPSIFRKSLNSSKNSNLNGVMKLNLAMIFFFFFVFETPLKDFPFFAYSSYSLV